MNVQIFEFRRLPYAQHRTLETSIYAVFSTVPTLNAAETLASLHRTTRKPPASLLRSDLNGGIIGLMTTPPIRFLHDLGPQAQMMSKNCGNERLAMILQYVALGSMIIMAGAAASQVLRDTFGSHDRGRGRDWSR